MDKQINIMELLKIFLKRWWCILLAVIIGMTISGVYTVAFVEPLYMSYGTLYTENTTDVMNQNVTEVNLSTVMVRKELVATYAEILSSNTFLQKVADECGLGYSSGEILNMLSMKDKNETEILIISVTSLDPKHSHIIAQTIFDLAPTFINEIVEGGSVKVLDQPVYTAEPSSPNIIRKIEIGAVLGLLVSLVIVLAIEMLDNKVKDAETVAETFKYPILGEIPYFVTTTKKEMRKNKRKKANNKESETLEV